jgi:hypothetical protein
VVKKFEEVEVKVYGKRTTATSHSLNLHAVLQDTKPRNAEPQHYACIDHMAHSSARSTIFHCTCFAQSLPSNDIPTHHITHQITPNPHNITQTHPHTKPFKHHTKNQNIHHHPSNPITTSTEAASACNQPKLNMAKQLDASFSVPETFL